jgi:Asp-tRNA(Asn)/Glu-tRNA(Gln) amidotransferase C subunit
MNDLDNKDFAFTASQVDTTNLRVEKTRRQELSRNLVKEGVAKQEDLFLVPRSVARGMRFQYKA